MQRVWILKNSRKYIGKVCEFRGVFSLFLFIFHQSERICDLTALKLNTFFSTDIKSLLSCSSKMALLIGQILRNGQSLVCLRCIVIGQYSVERQRTLSRDGVAGTETRERRLRNTWKSCMKRNIMRSPCRLYFWGFFSLWCANLTEQLL